MKTLTKTGWAVVAAIAAGGMALLAAALKGDMTWVEAGARALNGLAAMLGG